MTRGNILTEEEIARLAALPEKQRDYAVKIYAAREKKNPQPTSSGSSSPSTTSTSAIP